MIYNRHKVKLKQASAKLSGLIRRIYFWWPSKWV